MTKSTRVRRFVTSDTHFGHSKVLDFQPNRKYSSMEEMHENMIIRWNSVVPVDGIVYVIGDFCFLNVEEGLRILSRLNGTKILIRGNHDDNIAKMEKMGFAAVIDSCTIEVHKKKFKMCHFPYFTWKDWFSKYILRHNITHFDKRPKRDDEDVLLHGHVHDKWKKHNKDKTMINVCWDVWGRPVSFDEIISILERTR